MVRESETRCPNCGGELRCYDHVQRIIRTKRRETKWVRVMRVYCKSCGHVHRALPDIIFPYRQYEAEVIFGVLEGFITPETLGFEDYPCEMTMQRWRT
ncbi:MAG: DUF6431 domain-containing protein [Oscillospiraceae bacterium]|nr:DUF6431 domain-containing protein [Oscillospiraceae bacterium]